MFDILVHDSRISAKPWSYTLKPFDDRYDALTLLFRLRRQFPGERFTLERVA